MADVHHQQQQQGGPSTARRRKNAAKSKPQASNDWPRAGEPRSRASPRPKRHGDIDVDIVESSDDASAANHASHARPSSSKQPRRHRPRPPSSTTSDTASDTTRPGQAPQRSPKRPSKSMRVPNASVPVLDAAAAHRRPTCIIEEDDDDDDDPAPSGRRGPTSVSDSEDDTDATSDSDEEQVIEPRSKHLPPAPMAPAVPPAPQLNAVPASLQERLSRRPEMVYEEEDGDGVSRYAPDSNTPVSKTAKLKCCHRMCHSCLRKLFKLSLTNPQQHMPPRCCTATIPTEFVGLLFDSSFKKEWNEKFMEHTGRGRLVCPSRRCGELMRPEDMRCEAGRWQDQANSRSNPFASRPASPRDRDFRSDFAPPTPTSARPRPSSYEEDPYMRRLHEQREDHLTRRMHSFDAFGHHSHADFDRNRREYDFEDAREPRERRRRAEYEASFPDDDYHRRAATVVAPSPPQPAVPAAPPPPRSAFDPPSRPAFDRSASGFDYGSPSHRARGARYASPERYDDYMMESYPPERRQTRSPDAWQSFPHEQRPRSRDRRHTFPTESRPTSPDTWQLPTRYPSPERPMPAAEEKRRAPSPDRRRASSLERRLAGRFKKESRQSPGAPGVPAGAIGPVGPIGPISPGGVLGPLSPTRVPPPPSRAATHIGASMPMAPVPPSVAHAAPSAVPALRRHHTMEEDVYGGPGGMHGPGPGPGDMVPPEMNINGSPRAAARQEEAPQGVAHREHNKVSEWVNYVEPGPPEDAATVVQ
ncbi:hypothetical protein NEMBOFW57_007365 [Staphylotrichum longicolle]|uniref:Uncharacterized protein n=1 Tax=Staphylotrichum longicolle TaxID=669026 RepID=A0AAD4EUI4_9PEZI|nr:hypothetical protein NEMBOFW57_007365 [Staphylotrichum longicolle]